MIIKKGTQLIYPLIIVLRLRLGLMMGRRSSRLVMGTVRILLLLLSQGCWVHLIQLKFPQHFLPLVCPAYELVCSNQVRLDQTQFGFEFLHPQLYLIPFMVCKKFVFLKDKIIDQLFVYSKREFQVYCCLNKLLTFRFRSNSV